MQQDRLIGAAGEGHYGAVRGWAGPAGVRQQPARPRAARPRPDAERLDLGHEPVRASGARRAAGRLDGPRRSSRISTTSARTRRIRDEQTAALLEWLDGRRRRPTPRS